MTKEDLIKFLKDNLELRIEDTIWLGESKIRICLYLGEDLLSYEILPDNTSN